MASAKKTLLERFLDALVYTGDCIVWGGPTRNGYGRLQFRETAGCDNKSRIPAHIFAYEQMHGPIPKGMDLDHLCRNRCCVNVAHLEVVPRSENLRRGHVSRKTEQEWQSYRQIRPGKVREIFA
jgi:hypothetical protein